MARIRRLLATGCGGFVGSAVAHEMRPPWECHALTRGPALLHREGQVWHTLNILSAPDLERVFNAVSPDVVIHAAACADIDLCEADKDAAHNINVEVTRNLAQLCRARETRMILVSTDTVFDGTKGNYTESDPPGPVNWYAETKAAAERIVAGLPSNWVVVRTSLVAGLPLLGSGKSSISRALSVLQAGGELAVSDREIRSPIDVVTLARALIELAGMDFSGYLHLAGNDVLNRFDMTRRIAAKFGLPVHLVVPRTSADASGGAPRPLDVSLCNAKARSMLKTPMLGLEAGLDLALSTKKGIVL